MSWRTLAVGSAVLLVTLAGCREPRVGPPPSAPDVASATDAIPADLDVVIRVDLGRMRDALGRDAVDRIRSRVGSAADARPGDRALLSEAVGGASTVWLAFRPGPALELTDSVMVFEGRFDEFDPRRHDDGDSWRGPRDLGGGWLVFERRRGGGRAAPAQVYVRGPDLVVLVSVAEIDSAERSIEGGTVGAHLDPSSRGVISVDARAGAVARWIEGSSPAAASLLRRAVRVRAHGDVEQGRLIAEAEVEFREEQAAIDAAEGARAVVRAAVQAGGSAARLARNVGVSTVGSTLVLRVAADGADLFETAGQPGSTDP